MFCVNKKLLLIVALGILFLSSIFFLNRNKFSYKTSAANRYAPSNIQGGWDANRGEYPYMVALYDKSKLSSITHDMTNVFFCGGVLIKPQWVLTATHCLYYLYTDPITKKSKLEQSIFTSNIGIAINIINLRTDYDDNSVYNASKIIPDPYYYYMGSIQVNNDIALIKLDKKVPDTIASVKIADIEKNKRWQEPFLNSYIVGWGETSTNSGLSERLQKAILAEVYFNGPKKAYLYSNSLSVQPLHGDSGGPLLYSQNGVNKLLGIVHGDDKTIYVYVAGSSKKKWINDTVSAN